MSSDFVLFEPAFEYAPYACLAATSRGRLYPEPETRIRSPFQRDRDRIIHSSAFRRLKHKTQVFVYHEGDHYRTRLTHSIEVSQIARSIARVLGLNEEITEALSLVHDFGHPPFGHAGEEALNLVMAPHGGFDHNAQSLRIVTRLERRYADFDGLNLTWETLEGLAKHNGPLCRGQDMSDLHSYFAEYNERHDLELHTHASAEAQVAALSDDIAYNNHDIADGLRAGLFTMEELCEIPLVAEIVRDVYNRYGALEASRYEHEVIRRLINRMVKDILEESRSRLLALKPETVKDIRQAPDSVVAFSSAMRETDRRLKTFLMRNMYRHYKVNRMTSKAKRVVQDLFELYMEEPECLPEKWQNRLTQESEQDRARHVTDFIAGMTDRYALLEHKRLFDISAFEL
ncbi:deoxyguanosinetriphosphate triphosphohydrolase [Luteithermobacter gelatinilyticus]|uniref:deoxyguanosinetriphosphate triphosphohydrolase n=1 Tax=Luteithermobacter gelatinilyticus TaxID=2582913 RepID=UPI00110731C7|nr:deoxyguanosinetriphosphate triphosphohydrolase [Luteithermobacter gelatinilyticus]|tara:strand:- start:2558 stop:3760 length:1203 start_codon:yes stop_codon:yes gene_type:complete